MSRLFLSPRHLHTIERHAAMSYPEECCGVLIGRNNTGSNFVERVLSVGNVCRESRESSYAINPETVLAAHQQARVLGLEVLGYYHSHPDRPALPSEADREQAWPGMSYLIVSLRKGRVDEVRSWRLSAACESFEEEPVEKEAAPA